MGDVMKRVISILMTLILLFFIYQLVLTYFKSGHEISYQVFYNDKTFDIREIYSKDLAGSYDVEIKKDGETYYYVLQNQYNKQKRIIKNIEYYEKDNITCIYPILLDNSGSYLQCSKNNQRYSNYALNDDFINEVYDDLKLKGYYNHESNINQTEKLSNSTIYSNNLVENDYIALWNYKGIQIISNDNLIIRNTLNYDKYENKHGYLVDKYYVVPDYLNSKVSEFSMVKLINMENGSVESLKLEYTLSSDTYINGVVDNKIYYTDPVNLLQIEINPANSNNRLIGNKELGAQLYENGNWKVVSIYDFVNKKVLFSDTPEELKAKYDYEEIAASNDSYYFYNRKGEVYQIPKMHLDVSILLFKTDGLNNFKVVGNTVYYVMGDTLYYFNLTDGAVPILKNNELRFNKFNRIDIYRK